MPLAVKPGRARNDRRVRAYIMRGRDASSQPPQASQDMDEKQLQKLIRKNAAKAAKLAKARDGRQFDKTLPPPRDEDTDIERTHFFKEMKKREF